MRLIWIGLPWGQFAQFGHSRLGLWQESGGNVSVTCRLAGNRVNGQLADLTNSPFRPEAGCGTARADLQRLTWRATGAEGGGKHKYNLWPFLATDGVAIRF